MQVTYRAPDPPKGTVDIVNMPAGSWWFIVGILDNLDHPLIKAVTHHDGLLTDTHSFPSHHEGAQFIRKIRGDGK